MEAQVEKLYSDMEQYNDSFKRLRYESAFEAYLYANRPYLQEILDEINNRDNPSRAIEKLSKHFVNTVKLKFSAGPDGFPNWEKQLALNVFTTSYVLPAMLSMNSSLLKQLAEEICSCWRKAFKKSNISCATFQELYDGFKSKPCYITTAICQSQGKADDCYELQLLRSYRDGYLAHIPEGKELIDRYYEMAPLIVKAIDQLPDHKEIYLCIYEEHLMPCIRLIEEDKMAEALSAYKSMTESLYKKYIAG